jgi:hypothetical protein
MNQAAEALLKRYRDAYNVANSTVQVGGMLKKAAVWAAGVVGVLGLLMFFRSPFFGIPLMLVGLLFGFLLFVSGIITAAQGQIMLAMLDTAVNTSSNTDAPEKAAIMGLRAA